METKINVIRLLWVEMLQGPYACMGFFTFQWENTKPAMAYFSFLKSMQGIFSVTNPEKLYVFIFPRTLKNLFADSSMWLIMPLTVVSNTVFSARMGFCEALLSSSPSGEYSSFSGTGDWKETRKKLVKLRLNWDFWHTKL